MDANSMTFISYAQNFEDVMLMRALKGVKRGCYIDVGACAPDADSVTRLFYEQGWRGINVEPNPHYLSLLSEQRAGDKNLGIALSDAEGMQTFHVIGDTGLSSLSAEIAATHKTAGMSSTEISVSVLTLQKLWIDHIPTGCDVHFLKIDVEGLEASVIRGGDWAKHRPWIVVVEATAPASQEPSHKEWEPILLAHGYGFAYWDGLNRFYVADEHADLKSAFSAPPNVFDNFVLYSQVLIEQQAKDLNIQRATLVEERARLVENYATLVEERARLVEERGVLNERLREEQMLLMHEQYRSHTLENQVRILKRPLWEKILFRKTGRPVRLVRRGLFHTSGKPRTIFRRIVLHKNGRPRRAFHEWMINPDYPALPGVVAGVHHWGILEQEPSRSPRTQYFMDRMDKKTSVDRVE